MRKLHKKLSSQLCEGLLHTSVSVQAPRDSYNLINQLICKYILIYSRQIFLGVKLSDSKPYAVHKSRTLQKYHRLPQCKYGSAHSGPHIFLSPKDLAFLTSILYLLSGSIASLWEQGVIKPVRHVHTRASIPTTWG